ncbi:MAG: ATP-dependent metallopeptidase FtsH/Yme1/Tma family protein, partial [Lachnospiraceae bacterium]|nr:ATP-dependent metallopeptidase FtsH/Yme1/Tma family protein [Lachnospiraceae bacterium]
MNSENNQNGSNQDDKQNNKQNKGGLVAAIIATILIFFFVSWIREKVEESTRKEITYDVFLDMLEEGNVESVEFTGSKIEIKPKTQENSYYAVTYYTGYVNDDNLVARLNKADVKYQSVIEDTSTGILEFFMWNVFPFVLVFGSMWFLFRPIFKGGGMMGVGKSNAKVYVEKETGVTFQDVAGQEEAKDSLRELVDFLHNPVKYAQIGAKLPKGALLVGPPGTGKTLLAKALAGEAKVPFFSLSGSDFVELYVGVGASRVRDLFKQAQQKAPCIIFIDEVDAIGKSRDGHHGGNDEREQTLNQLLSEMDGFDTSKGLVVLAATNRPEVLDKALLRPGRFDRRVIVDKPDLKGRIDVLRVHAKNVMMDESVDLEEIALATSGAVGSDLANMINEAAIMAVRVLGYEEYSKIKYGSYPNNGRMMAEKLDLFDYMVGEYKY